MIEYSHYDSPMSPHSFLSVVHKRRNVILALFVLIVVVIVGLSFILPPIYRSTAQVMVKYQPELEKYHLLHFYQPRLADYDELASETVVVKMRSILEPVVNALKMDQRKSKKAEEDASTAAKRHERAIEKLSEQLVVEREKDTNVLTISYENRNPRLAASVVDKVITEYIEQRPTLDRDDSAYEYFDKQINVVKSQIDEIERRGRDYKSQQKVISPDKQTQILFTSIADFDHELTKVRAERISKEARLKIIKEQAGSEDDVVFPATEISSSYSRFGYLTKLKDTLLELELRKVELSKKYTENHPEVIAVLAAIKEAKRKIAIEFDELLLAEETAVKALRAEEDALAARMNQAVASIAKLSEQEYELGKITIGINDLKDVHSMLIRQREEAQIAASKKEHLVYVRLLEPAMVPQSPVKPNKLLYAALALLLGIFISFGVAFFQEYFDHSVNTVEDAQHCLGLPILAAIADFDPAAFSTSLEGEPQEQE